MTKTYVFPGQGSQKLGMGEALFSKFPKQLQTANDIVGYKIDDLCLQDPENKINHTQFTQVALFVVNALSYLEKKESQPKPSILAGHSLGEYNALFAAGVFNFETGCQLVQKRGQLMANAHGGGMAAVIGLSAEVIQETLSKESLTSIDIANYNAPLQTVISGPKDAIEISISLLKEAGARLVIPLKVSAAFHSRYMEKAAQSFETFLSSFTFHEPLIPVIANVTALPYGNKEIKKNLSHQINHSVRWVETIQYIRNISTDTEFEEIGPGRVLTGLIKQIVKSDVKK